MDDIEWSDAVSITTVPFQNRVKCERCEVQDNASGGKGTRTLFAHARIVSGRRERMHEKHV